MRITAEQCAAIGVCGLHGVFSRIGNGNLLCLQGFVWSVDIGGT